MSSRRRLVVTHVLSTALALASTGCGGDGSSTATDPDDGAPQLGLAGDWRLVSGTVAGQDLELQHDYPVTLKIDGEPSDLDVGGQSGCNHYGAKADASGAELAVSDVESTLMGCAEPVLSLETTYLSALSDVTAYERTTDRLVLTGVRTQLTFEPLLRAP